MVFHLAGKAHALAETKQDENTYFRINTEATERLLQACRKHGIKTFVYFSSVKVVGDIDTPSCLADLLESLNALAETYDAPIIFSVHPRTRKRLDDLAHGNIDCRIAYFSFM